MAVRTGSSKEIPVTIPNGENVPVEGRMNHILVNRTKVQDILHVPKYNCNLLYVSKILKDLKCSVTFFPDFFVMQGATSQKYHPIFFWKLY
uniref:Uncharacterized protein n=1 Tax=Lactuca sativa TaxID=4236 RepID=A0A9R1XPU5_LACSA|nr:hypothetical protein LSAT_V11C200070810 [Lactuca sativa]